MAERTGRGWENIFSLSLDEMLTDTNRKFVIIDRDVKDDEKRNGYGWSDVKRYIKRRIKIGDLQAKLMHEALETESLNAIIVLYVPRYNKRNGKFLSNYTLAVLPHLYLENAPNFMGAPLCGNKLPVDQGVGLFHHLFQDVGEEGPVTSFYQMFTGTGKELRLLGAHRPDSTTERLILEELGEAIKTPIRDLALFKPKITLYEPDRAFLRTRSDYATDPDGKPVLVPDALSFSRTEAIDDANSAISRYLALSGRMLKHAERRNVVDGPSATNVVDFTRTTFERDGKITINKVKYSRTSRLFRWFRSDQDHNETD